jgi:hypothetical protein
VLFRLGLQHLYLLLLVVLLAQVLRLDLLQVLVLAQVLRLDLLQVLVLMLLLDLLQGQCIQAVPH